MLSTNQKIEGLEEEEEEEEEECISHQSCFQWLTSPEG
jgi:hypothetical protein